MSRQIRFYLLPSDVEALAHKLKSELDVSLIQPWSPHPKVVAVESAVLKGGLLLKKGISRVDCYLVPPSNADIKMRFVSNRSRWHVDIASEVIEFKGCEFDGSTLLLGRLYFQKDFLAGDAITLKREDFLRWADKVFRLAKKSLNRSKALDAYVGQHAEKWRRGGGKFAWTATAERGPIYEQERSHK